MEIKKGVPVSPGIAIRRAFHLDTEGYQISKRFLKSDEIEGEIVRLDEALAKAKTDVEALEAQYRRSGGDLGNVAAIFGFYRAILEDPALRDEVVQRVKESKFTPEYAVSRTFQKKIKAFKAMKDEYLAQRHADFHDVEQRLLRALAGTRAQAMKRLSDEVILIAKDLTPSQTATLDTTKVVGFATDAGGRTSHTAIVARALGIPAVVALGNITSEVPAGELIILDGTHGKVIISPDEQTLKEYRAKEKQFIEFERSLTELKDLPAETLDGHTLTLLANIEFPEEIKTALENGAEGIGLYRTEFLYVNGEPDEDTHFKAYKRAVDELDGRPLVIRTLDLGADKFAEASFGPSEPNPFLGCRSIRLCFQRIDLFKAQLRAILRATAYGPIKIMLPMIASLNEVRKAKVIINDVMEDLTREKIAFDDEVKVGIMVEVPSAALIADFLAQEVDFFSIGTNDLVQYTLAVDRVNERVADLYQPAHPAILRLLLQVIEAGSRHGVEVSMCGEMSGEVVYTIPLLGLGLRTFSISPGTIPEVKKVLRSITLKEAVQVVERIFTFSEAKQTESYLREKAKRIIPQLF